MHDVDHGRTKAKAEDLLEQVGGDISRVLDFGAGEGHLVAAFRSLGIHADGVETSDAARAEARRRHGLDLLRDIPCGPGARYDLILLVHSLEHVDEPVAVLRSLRGQLNPHGRIFIDVPNADSFEVLRPSRRRSILELPLHLYHFTPASLGAVVKAAGLTVVSLRLTNPQWLEWLLSWRARRRVEAHENRHARAGIEIFTKPPSPSIVGRAWRRHLLPLVRGCSPGWRFEVLAEMDGYGP